MQSAIIPSVRLSYASILLFGQTDTHRTGCSTRTTKVVGKEAVLSILMMSDDKVIAYRVSRRRREMFSGHARLSVSLSVCSHAHTTARTQM